MGKNYEQGFERLKDYKSSMNSFEETYLTVNVFFYHLHEIDVYQLKKVQNIIDTSANESKCIFIISCP